MLILKVPSDVDASPAIADTVHPIVPVSGAEESHEIVPVSGAEEVHEIVSAEEAEPYPAPESFGPDFFDEKMQDAFLFDICGKRSTDQAISVS